MAALEKDFLAAMLDAGVPILAVCLGAQVLAERAAGEPRRRERAGDRLVRGRGHR